MPNLLRILVLVFLPIVGVLCTAAAIIQLPLTTSRDITAVLVMGLIAQINALFILAAHLKGKNDA